MTLDERKNVDPEQGGVATDDDDLLEEDDLDDEDLDEDEDDDVDADR